MPYQNIELTQWLNSTDALPLECDGLTRVISALMNRENMAHKICIGSLRISGVGVIPRHWWIGLENSQYCDYRARMWLGNDPLVPHGVFSPQAHHQYEVAEELTPGDVALPASVIAVLAGRPIDSFPRLLAP